MKDPADTITADLIPSPKGRGRPKTAKAMTPAERKAAQRARDKEKAWDLASTPHKVPPRIIAQVLETPENYGKAAGFAAWLEMGERMGWITGEERRTIMRNRQA